MTKTHAKPPVAADALTADELRRLTKADRKLTHADPAIRSQGGQEILDLTRRRTERGAQAQLAANLAETLSLARARSEEVRQRAGRIRILSRGGLQLAFERGDLDGERTPATILYDTGRAYLWAFEVSARLTTSERNLGFISARTPLRASAGPQDAIFAAAERLRAMRTHLTERQRAVLDRVCGLDMTVRATALQMRAGLPATRKALREGLAKAADAPARAAPPRVGKAA